MDKYITRHELIGIEPYSDKRNMAIIRTSAAAEQIVTEGLFLLESLLQMPKLSLQTVETKLKIKHLNKDYG